MAKGGSKLLTGLIAFLLGFIFAILVEVGAIVGVYFYVTRTDLDNIFQTIGIQNKDEDGNYIYINTDNENGGAQNLGELLSLLQGYLYSEGSSAMDYPVLGKSFDEIGNLLPITQKLLAEKLYPAVEQFVDIDWEEFEKKPISEIPQFLSDSVMDIRPAKLLGKVGMDGLVGEDANVMVKALLAGAEFDYAQTTSGLKFPVYYDEYVYNSSLSRYYREEAVNNQQAYPADLSEDLLFKTGTQNDDNEDIYRLYYIPCSVSGGGLSDARLCEDGETIYEQDTSFYVVRRHNTKKEYELILEDEYKYLSDYGLHNMDRTGNFYYTNGGEELQIYPVTIRSFSDSEEVFKPLYSVSVTEVVGDGENHVIGELFGSLSIGELMDGKADFDEMVGNLSLPQVINVDPEQSIMAYIGYGITNIKHSEVSGCDYEGYVKVDGVSTPCFITYELKGEPAHRAINRVWYYGDDGKVQEVEGTKVKEVANLASDLEISALLDVKADDAIISYLGYGLTGVVKNAGVGYTHTGTCEIEEDEVKKQVSCFIDTDEDGRITQVWYVGDDGENHLVSGTTVNKISDRVSGIMDNIAITDVMDVEWDNAIMVYMGYGVTGVSAQNGAGYTHVGSVEVGNVKVPCYINVDDEGNITEVWRYDGTDNKVPVSGTKISQVSDRMGGITDNLTLPDVLDITADESVTAYIGYGLTNIEQADGAGYTHTATYVADDGTETDCFILTDDNGKITSVWYMEEGNRVFVQGTVIGQLSEKIDSLAEHMTLGDVMDVSEDDKILWALRDTKISELGEKVKTLKIKDVLDEEDIEKSAILRQLKDKSIDEMSTAIDAISIQSIYTKEVYGFGPEEAVELSEVTEYKRDILYFIKEIDEDGSVTYTYVNSELYDDDDQQNDYRVGKLLSEDEFNAGIASGIEYYSYGEARGMWRLILFRDDVETGVNGETVYTLNNFNNMIAGCTKNINNATLKTLQEAGIIDENSNLDKEFVWYTNNNGVPERHSRNLGGMKLKELIDAVINMDLSVLPGVGN